MISLLFFGSGTFPTPILEKLHKDKKINIVGLITSPFLTDNKRDVSNAAHELGIEVYREEKIQRTGMGIIKLLNPDINLVCNYGQIIPEEIIKFPKHKTLNIHCSILPTLRGACPIEMAILRGHKRTGISIQVMEETLDTGDVIFEEAFDIDQKETGGSLTKKCQEISTKYIDKVIIDWTNGKLKRKKQDDSKATYCYRSDLSKNEAQLKWTDSAVSIEREIRAFNPRPTAWAFIDDPNRPKRLKFFAADIETGTLDIEPGESVVIENKLKIQTGDGVLLPTEVQSEGKKIMSIEEFLMGYKGKLSFI